MNRRTLGALASLSIALSTLTASAAPTKGQCVTANANAQTLRRDGKLSLARVQLEMCADPACPAIVRKDCIERRDDLERVQPTLVFEAKDGAGHDLISVTVKVDGRPFVSRLDGTALPIDPGPHTFTFDVPGEATVTRDIVVHEGDVGRHEAVTMGPPAAPPPVATPTTTAAPVEPVDATPAPPPTLPTHARTSTSTQVLSAMMATAGVAGLAVGTAYGLMAASKWSDAKNDCPTSSCTVADYATAMTERTSALDSATISTVTFIAGGALVAASGLYYFLGRATDDSIVVAPAIAPGAASLVFSGRF